jgi:hypothetical protein
MGIELYVVDCFSLGVDVVSLAVVAISDKHALVLVAASLREDPRQLTDWRGHRTEHAVYSFH